MNILTEEQQAKIVADALAEITAQMKDNVVRQSKWAIEEEAVKQTRAVVKQFMEEEVGPQILVALEEQKSALIQGAILGAEKMAEELANALAKAMAENLANSWKRKKILEELFG